MNTSDFTARARTSSGRLIIQYEIANESDRDLCIFNLLYENRPDRADINLCNVEIASGAVVVSKKLVDVPEDMDVEKLNIPFVTTILPGARYTEMVNLELPLRRQLPYADAGPTEISVKLPLLFQIGFFYSQIKVDGPIAKVFGKEFRKINAISFSSQSLATRTFGNFLVDVFR